MLVLLATGLLTACVIAWLPPRARIFSSALSFGYPAATFLWAAGRLPVAPGTLETEALPWVPSLGIELAFGRDGLGTLFALLIGGIGALVALHASSYLGDAPYRRRFAALLVLFATAMLGVVLADDLVTLFVFWELTSISSFLLIGLDHEKGASRAAALRALLVTGAGGIALLGGFLCLALAGQDAGLTAAESFRISALTGVDLTGHTLYPLALVLVLLGAFTKSAQVPFHFWLPAAMAAPTPVSAFLHSATMVKAGVFLLARLHPVLGGTPLWIALIVPAGAVTMIVAAGMAIAQRDMKRILAYSTVSVLGILTMLLGVGTVKAIEAALVLLVAHAMYKAALFLVAGNVDHEAGARDVTEVGGLWRAMPWTAAAACTAALSKAGAPPMFGFVGKELLYKAKLDVEVMSEALVLVAVAANVLLVGAALLIAVPPFFGRHRAPSPRVHEAPWPMRIGPLVLAAGGVFVGLLPAAFDAALGSAAATAVVGETTVMKLKLWHGVNPSALAVLVLSAATLALGYGAFRLARPRLAGAARVLERLGSWGPDRGFEVGYEGLLDGAAGFARRFAQAPVRRASTIAVGGLVVIGAALAFNTPGTDWNGDWNAPSALTALVGLITVSGAVITVRARAPMTALAGLGVSGIGVAATFLMFSAPDLAITQILVETLIVLVLLPVLSRAPQIRAARTGRAWRLPVAMAAGVAMGYFCLVAAASPLPADLRAFVDAESLPSALGRNVVNVILVDFRALDTLGEIIVVAAAALGIVGLLQRRGNRDTDGEGQR